MSPVAADPKVLGTAFSRDSGASGVGSNPSPRSFPTGRGDPSHVPASRSRPWLRKSKPSELWTSSENFLIQHPNVIGLGIVPKGKRGSKGGMAIGVYVSRKLPEDHVSADELVPDHLEIPGKHGPVVVPTRVIEQGEVRLESLE